MNNSSNYIKGKEQDENNPAEETVSGSGVLYRASGNLFIVKTVIKTRPRVFDCAARAAINSFSPGASTRMRRYLRECLPEYKVMVTLTYPGSFPTNGKATKEHLRRFLQEIRREYMRRCDKGDVNGSSHSSFWFLEFQSRGAPHYHIFTTWAPNKEWVAKRWYEIVGSEDERHLRAGTRTEFLRTGRAGTISYAAKYAAKQEQKRVPEFFDNVGRFWGVHGWRAVMSATTFVASTGEAFDRVYSSRKAMFLALQRFISDGRADVLHRDNGVLVVNMPEEYVQKRMRMHVSRMTAMTAVHDGMFSDAELDEGETFAPNIPMDERIRDLTESLANGYCSKKLGSWEGPCL